MYYLYLNILDFFIINSIYSVSFCNAKQKYTISYTLQNVPNLYLLLLNCISFYLQSRSRVKLHEYASKGTDFASTRTSKRRAYTYMCLLAFYTNCTHTRTTHTLHSTVL